MVATMLLLVAIPIISGQNLWLHQMKAYEGKFKCPFDTYGLCVIGLQEI